jgi:nucleoside-diphosphate-sugar epimerase
MATAPGVIPLVLVTGGSGFVASNIILALLSLGYRCRTTVRSIEKIPLYLRDVPKSAYKLEARLKGFPCRKKKIFYVVSR